MAKIVNSSIRFIISILGQKAFDWFPDTKIYNFMSLLSIGDTRKYGLVKAYLICLKAICYSSPQTISLLLSSLSSGENAFNFSVEFAMNLFRKLILQTKPYSSFLFGGGLTSSMALTLFLSTSILWWYTKKMRKFLARTLKAHLVGFIFRYIALS